MRADDWDSDRFRALLTAIQASTGLDDAAMAEMAGNSRSQMNKWRVRGDNRPSYERIAALARELTNRHPAVAGLAQELLTATGYTRSPSRTDHDVELPEGFDPDVLPRAVVEIYGIHDTPLNVRELLVQTWRLAMGDPLPGLQHVVPTKSPGATERNRSAAS